MANKQFSIITICFNDKDGLEKTILSTIHQSFKNFEYIVIDGGSTDGSKIVIENYSSRIDYWVSEPDKGIFDAMNKGTKKATGNYLIFMNAGDTFHSDSVLQEINNLNINTDIICGYTITNNNGNYTHQHKANLIELLMYSSLSHQGTFIKRELCLKYLYDIRYKTASDWKFWIQTLIVNNYTMNYCDIIVANQDMTGITTGQDSKDKQDEERSKILLELFPKIVTKEDFPFREQIVKRTAQLLQERMHIAVVKHNSQLFKIRKKELLQLDKNDLIHFLGNNSKILLFIKTNYLTIYLYLFVRKRIKGY